MKKNNIFKQFSSKSKKEKITIILISLSLIAFLFFGTFANILFPGSDFANFIDSSIGNVFNIADFFVTNSGKMVESISLLVLVFVIYKLLKFIFLKVSKRGKRSITIIKLLLSVLKYAAVIVALFVVLDTWGINSATLLASVGIAGIAISFGTQSLIEDIISGFFIIFERQFSVGDTVELNDFRGIVKEIGIRTTKIEDIRGAVKIFNNSDVRGLININSDLAPCICNIAIAYEEDIEKVDKIILESFEDMKAKIPDIVGEPYYGGIQNLGASGVELIIIVRAKEKNKYQVTRDLNKFMKILFNKNNIEIPYNKLVISNPKD